MLQLSDRYNIPDLPSADELLPLLKQIDANRWYSNFGPLTMEFEAKFASAMAEAHGKNPQRNHASTVSSGYHALVVGLRLLNVGKGGKVLVPSINFPACPLAIQHVGAETIIADVDPATWLLTPAIAKAIAEKTKISAIMPVAIHGVGMPADEWDKFHEETGIPVIIDAAAAIETQKYPKHGLVAHSLHALKPFGVGEGGLLMFTNEQLIYAIRQYTNFGTIDRITYIQGENAKLSEYHAAVALTQLKRWPKIKERRKLLYKSYKKALGSKGLDKYIMPGLDDAIVSTFMMSIPGIKAQKIIDNLKQEHIAAHHTYLPPLYRHPHFNDISVASTDGKILKSYNVEEKTKLMTASENLSDSVIGLPFHPFMTEDNIDFIVGALARMI